MGTKAINNQFLCGDQDLDNCDDCASGIFNLNTDCDYLGDLNADGTFDVVDVVLLIEYVLNGEYINNADLNTDGVVNVVDIVMLVNIILN